MSDDRESMTPSQHLTLRMLRGPLVWGVFLLVGYLLAEGACIRSIGTVRSTRIAILTLAAVAVLICLAMAAASFRRWRQDDGTDWDRSYAGYVDPAGSLLALGSAAAVAVTGVMMIGLSSCR